jgi:hypothetical protein
LCFEACAFVVVESRVNASPKYSGASAVRWRLLTFFQQLDTSPTTFAAYQQLRIALLRAYKHEKDISLHSWQVSQEERLRSWCTQQHQVEGKMTHGIEH